jgi:hypothetical protein
MNKALVILVLLFSTSLWAQGEKENKNKEKDPDEEKTSFKEKLFTGGSISLAFYNNTFLIGGSPVFGVSLTNWIDGGVVVNYNYTAYRDVNMLDDKLHQNEFGGGAFLKLYPVRFLFAQAQIEHNWINQKYIPPQGGGPIEKVKFGANSFLIGGGYTTGRQGRGGGMFYYLSVLFDIMGDINSPYTDAYGRTIPIIRGGIQIPLFQGKNSHYHSRPGDRDRYR